MRFVRILSIALLLAGGPAGAQQAEVVVGIPVKDGRARRPQPALIVRPNEKRASHEIPVVLPQNGPSGVTVVRPNFGGGTVVESPGQPTRTIRPRFGGGVSVEEGGRTTTEVIPLFGGGVRVERAPEAPVIVIPAPGRP